MSHGKKESLFWGLVVLVLGVLFLLRNIGWEIDVWDFIGKFWPLVLIYVGVKNIYLHVAKKR